MPDLENHITSQLEDHVFEEEAEKKNPVPEKNSVNNEQKFSELHISFLNGFVDCDYQRVNNILSKDQSLVNMKSPIDGNTALHFASKFGDIPLVRALVGNYKADVNIINHSGKTPLHYAAEFSRVEVARLLVGNYNAKKDIRDYNGMTPVDWVKPDQLDAMEDILGKQYYGTMIKEEKVVIPPQAKLGTRFKGFGSFLLPDTTSRHLKPSRSADLGSSGSRLSPVPFANDSGSHRSFHLAANADHHHRKGSSSKPEKHNYKGGPRESPSGKIN